MESFHIFCNIKLTNNNKLFTKYVHLRDTLYKGLFQDEAKQTTDYWKKIE